MRAVAGHVDHWQIGVQFGSMAGNIPAGQVAPKFMSVTKAWHSHAPASSRARPSFTLPSKITCIGQVGIKEDLDKNFVLNDEYTGRRHLQELPTWTAGFAALPVVGPQHD